MAISTKKKTAIIIVGFVVAAIVIIAGVSLLTGISSVPTSSTTPVSSSNISGLLLIVNTSVSGGNALVTMRLFNNLSTENNLSAMNKTSNETIDPDETLCEEGGPLLSFAVYKGYYTIDNLSTGTELDTFPNVVLGCPAFSPPVRYDFKAKSAYANVILKNGGNFTANEVSTLTINGTWSGGPCLDPSSCTLTPFSPGVYTVAAGDEWGQVVITHFNIT